jgi:hypothetical protein
VGVTAGPAHICVFRVEAVEDGEVRMRPVAEFDTPHGIFRWNIWNNQVPTRPLCWSTLLDTKISAPLGAVRVKDGGRGRVGAGRGAFFAVLGTILRTALPKPLPALPALRAQLL